MPQITQIYSCISYLTGIRDTASLNSQTNTHYLWSIFI